MKTCDLCQIWHDIPSEKRFTEKEGNRIDHKRYCPVISRLVSANKKACEDWELSKFIYCDGEKGFVYSSTCINRRKKGYCSGNCNIAMEISSSLRGRRAHSDKPTQTNNLILRKETDNGGSSRGVRLVIRSV